MSAEPIEAVVDEPSAPVTIHDLITLRSDVETSRAEVNARRRRFEEENASLFAHYRRAQEAMAESERTYRRQAEAEFLATGDKNPLPGASIRLRKGLDYDPGDATEWAIGCQQDLLVFDSLRFEQRFRDATTLPPFARRVTIPTVCLASDLEAALLPKPEKATVEAMLPEELR